MKITHLYRREAPQNIFRSRLRSFFPSCRYITERLFIYWTGPLYLWNHIRKKRAIKYILLSRKRSFYKICMKYATFAHIERAENDSFQASADFGVFNISSISHTLTWRFGLWFAHHQLHLADLNVAHLSVKNPQNGIYQTNFDIVCLSRIPHDTHHVTFQQPVLRSFLHGNKETKYVEN